MTLTNIIESPKKILGLLAVFIYIVLNLFHVGGDEFIVSLNNFIVIPLAVAITSLAWLLWLQNKFEKQQILWLGLAVGWTLWSLAEIWWAIATVVFEEVPYPSLADFFWLGGYVAILFALWKRLRSLPQKISVAQRRALWAISLLLSVFMLFFVIIPVIQESHLVVLLEGFISILYPFFTLLLLLLVLQILFSYQEGRYGKSWLLIAAGFGLLGIADVMYAYTIRIELYNQTNLISVFGVDVPYNLAFLLWFFALQEVNALRIAYEPVIEQVKGPPTYPNTYLVLSTKGDDTVIYNSRTYARFYSDADAVGKHIANALGLSQEDQRHILKEIYDNGFLAEQPFQVSTAHGLETMRLSGIVVLNPQKQYSGALFLARLHAEFNPEQPALDAYDKGMARSLLNKTGADEIEQEERKKFLLAYYQPYFTAIYNHVLAEGGSLFTDTFFSDLEKKAQEQGWKIRIHPNSLDTSKLTYDQIKKALPELLETARLLVARISGESLASNLIEQIRAKYNPQTVQAAEVLKEQTPLR